MNDLTALVNLITQGSALVILASISYWHFRQERARVTEIQEKRVVEHDEMHEARIEDLKRTIDTLTAILTARGVYPSSTITNIEK